MIILIVKNYKQKYLKFIKLTIFIFLGLETKIRSKLFNWIIIPSIKSLNLECKYQNYIPNYT